jgi:transposase
MFGPQLVAAVASLHGRFRLTEREIVAVLESLWGIKLSLGSVAEMCQKASLALAEIYEEAQKQIPKEPKLNLDETGWKLGGKKKHWLWVAVSRLVVVFHLDEKRDSAAFRKIVGEEYEGVVSSDRFRSYSGLEAEKHQWCWAHLIRDFRRMSERTGPGGIWGEEAMELSRQLFKEWHEYRQRAGQMNLQELKDALVPIRTDFKQLLEEGKTHEDGAVRSLCGELNKAEASLWVFSEVAGVEPTNNTAERALRPAVIWRKTCFGSQSEGGLRFVERMLTVAATLKQQGRDLIEFVTLALKAKWFGQPTPSLVQV